MTKSRTTVTGFIMRGLQKKVHVSLCILAFGTTATGPLLVRSASHPLAVPYIIVIFYYVRGAVTLARYIRLTKMGRNVFRSFNNPKHLFSLKFRFRVSPNTPGPSHVRRYNAVRVEPY